MRLAFAKYEGLGNDFLLIDTPGAAGTALEASQVVRLCDRHLGVGGDGVLLLSEQGGRTRMRVINADGSQPEMCGNGIRCVALHLLRQGRAGGGEAIEINTDAGTHACRVLIDGPESVIEVSMRAASLRPEQVPVLAAEPLIDAAFEAGGRRLQVTCVSMGNPHAVTFTEVGEQRDQIAALLQRDPRFPHQANVGFARMLAPDAIELMVYERGAGWTRACGTGACAAAVAAVETGRAPRHQPIEVRLPGGALAIVVGERDDRLSMTGPARHVFDGTIEF